MICSLANSGGHLPALSDVQRISDQEATEQATLDLALQESRQLYANRDYDDLETSLLLSISTAGASSSSSFTPLQGEKERESKACFPFEFTFYTLISFMFQM